jgi:hypothetical protein
MSIDQPSKSVFSDDVIRGFLLGRLGAAEQTKFEEQLMTDERLHERVRQAEFQLADDFVAGRIAPMERQRFLKNFTLTDDRRRIVSVSDELYRRFSRAKVSLTTRSWRSVFHQPALRFAFGVFLLLLLIGSLWLVTKQPQQVRNLIPKPLRPRPAATAPPQEANHPSNSAPPVHRESGSSLPEHESAPPGEAPESQVLTALALAPGALSDVSQTPTLALPANGAGVVRLELSVEQNISGEFQAELLTNASAVFVGTAAKVSGKSVNFDVPAHALKVGDYEVRLSRLQDGSKQTVANYYFRVR